MVTVRQVDKPIDSTFKADFIGDCDTTALVGENVAIFFPFKNADADGTNCGIAMNYNAQFWNGACLSRCDTCYCTAKIAKNCAFFLIDGTDQRTYGPTTKTMDTRTEGPSFSFRNVMMFT